MGSTTLVVYETFLTWLWGVVLGYPMIIILAVLQLLTAPWILVLLFQQLRLVSLNMTTNEMMNMHRYEHFWVYYMGQRRMRNPFNKGGPVCNCFDFWWARHRSDTAWQPQPCTAGDCHECHEHSG